MATQGRDQLFGGTGVDQLFGGVEGDFLKGDEGNDLLYGQAGNDVLVGDQGSDLLFGNEGDDEIHASSGNDTINGNSGSDLVYYLSDQEDFDVVSAGANYQITDLRAPDPSRTHGVDLLAGIEELSFGEPGTGSIASRSKRHSAGQPFYQVSTKCFPMAGDRGSGLLEMIFG